MTSPMPEISAPMVPMWVGRGDVVEDIMSENLMRLGPMNLKQLPWGYATFAPGLDKSSLEVG